jgi:hypothetical protein
MKEFAMSNVVISTVSDTVVVNNQVEIFANQYRMCINKTASAILELASVVFNAREELTKNQFKEFRQKIGADSSKDSYINKLCVIAENQSRFAAIRDQLPASYTTLYNLAKIDNQTFAKVIDAQIISPQMTAVRLSQCLNMSTVSAKSKITSTSKKQCIRFMLDLQNIENSIALKVISEVNQVCEKFLIHVEVEIDPMNAYFSEKFQSEFYDERFSA